MKRILKSAILPVIIFLIFQIGSGLCTPAAAAIQATGSSLCGLPAEVVFKAVMQALGALTFLSFLASSASLTHAVFAVLEEKTKQEQTKQERGE